MKHIALAALFAVSLTAQNEVLNKESAAKLELASVIAVEEQEKDLDKAQVLYRAAMEDKALSPAARAYAKQRLVALLRRLGNAKEAKALSGKGAVVSLDDVTNDLVDNQGPEREKQLRLQARELLRKLEEGSDPGDISEQLTWIGAPAVAEVVLHIQQRVTDRLGLSRPTLLYGFLWLQGSPRATAFLVEAAQSKSMVGIAAKSAYVIKEIDIQSPVARAYLDHSSWEITLQFLRGFEQSLDAAELLTLADRGGANMKVYVLGELARRTLNAKQRQRAHAMCRAAISGTSPEYGKAAEGFLTSSQSWQSLGGIQMLLDLMPDMHARGVPMTGFVLWNEDRTSNRDFTKTEAAALLPMVRTVVEKIGPIEDASSSTNWLLQCMRALMKPGGDPASQLALKMWDTGYKAHGLFYGQGSPSVAKQLLERWNKVPSNGRLNFLQGFDNVELSGDVLQMLEKIAAELFSYGQNSSVDHYKAIVAMVGRTGHDDAADWLAAEWRKRTGFIITRSRSILWAMLEVGKKNQSQRVRTAMGDMVRGVGGPAVQLEDRSLLLLALLSMGDERALDLVAVGTTVHAVSHPYAGDEVTRDVNPLNYLMFKNPNPPHGYSRKQILNTVSRYAQRISGKGGLDPAQMQSSSIPDDVLAVLATEDLSGYPQCWSQKLVLRLSGRIRRGEDFAVLEACFLSALGKPDPKGRWGFPSSKAFVARYAKQIRALIDGPDGGWAIRAVHTMQSQGESIDVAAMLRNKHGQVRSWAADMVLDGEAKVPPATLVPLLRDASGNVRESIAEHLGAIVYKQAVPGLIEQLRDTEPSVRTAAAEALTRIRFYHEQQAHWDRVLKGLDASPASATEKLLVQAKPDAPKQQRLLAIKSLGVLGAPEALPFLIDWTQDADKDIGEAAKEAITKIHLRPRK